jgi:hypothetical protein
LVKNMMETMEVLGVDPQDEVGHEETPTAATTGGQENAHSSLDNAGPPGAASSNLHNSGSPGAAYPSSKMLYPAITAGPHQATTVSPGDKAQRKRKGLTPEQKQKLEQMQQEQEAVRKVRVDNVSQKLLEKISVWTETDRSPAVTDAFQKKMQVV